MSVNHRNIKCLNCGKVGHVHKRCTLPRMSYGIISIHVRDNNEIFNDIKNFLQSKKKLPYKRDIEILNSQNIPFEKFELVKSTIEILMIMNKHTNGFTDFVRGKYRFDDYEQLSFLFKEMTQAERKVIHDYYNDFDALWKFLWNIKTKPKTPTTSPTNKTSESSDSSENEKKKKNYRYFEKREYECAKENFENLKNNKQLNLLEILKNTHSCVESPEWGVPKGRRMFEESDIDTAKREFTEETGYLPNDYILFDNIEPYIENIVGTNGVKYRYVYYIALLKTNKINTCKDLNNERYCEIGDIGLFDLNTSLTKIRQIHCERKNIIHSVFANIIEDIINK